MTVEDGHKQLSNTNQRWWLGLIAALSLAAALYFSYNVLSNTARGLDIKTDVIATGPITLSEGQDSYNVVPHLKFVLDPSTELSLSDIRSRSDWAPASTDHLSFGMTESASWLRIDLENPTSLPIQLYLALGNPRADHADLYLVTEDGEILSEQLLGALQPFGTRPIDHRHIVFPVVVPQNTSATAYLRVQTRTSQYLPLTLSTPTHWHANRPLPDRILIGAYGGIALILLVQSILFAVMRDKVLLFYATYTLGSMLYAMTLDGTAFQFLWPDAPEWGQTSSNFMGILTQSQLFIATALFLNTRINAPRLHPILQILTAASLAIATLSLFIDYRLAQTLIATFWGPGFAVLLITCALVAFGKHNSEHTEARIYLISLLVLGTSVVMSAYRLGGDIPSTPWTVNIMTLNILVHMLTMTLALAVRFRRLAHERETELQGRLAEAQKVAAYHQASSAFVPEAALKAFGKDRITEVKLGDHVDVTMTCLFIDVRSFATLSEQMSPEENTDFVNRLYGTLGPIVRDHGGFVARYIGDAMLCLFPSTPDNAVRAGQAMLNAATGLTPDGALPVRIGVGVHIGPMRLAVVGEQNRMEVSAYGDVVNTTARIEQLTKDTGHALLVSATAYSLLTPPVAQSFIPAGRFKLKGRSEQMDLFGFQSLESADIIDLQVGSRMVKEGT